LTADDKPPQLTNPPAARQTAPSRRAQSADAAYLQNLENAWRGPLGRQNIANPGRDARLTSDSHGRSDRMDSALRLVAEDSQWELWQDSHGRTIRRRK
jgi:hypothetical protein